MARTQQEQWLLRAKRDPQANRLAAAGDDWVRADIIANMVSRMLGTRSYELGRLGAEPWTEGERADFYVLFDALPRKAQEGIVASTIRLGESMPERADGKARIA